ncbi:hypothetical protein [Micromonospora aurantiaca (nom. illeg.)]|uniref:hypothetical protein n=1 Tax=Micromonospora aurantiaca (nom. illeg.) TaxID=47850 RepID=UPI003F4A273D
MPSRGTPRWAIRVPENLWTAFGEATEAAGTDRSAVLREFIRWYVREHGAKTPQRPGGVGPE